MGKYNITVDLDEGVKGSGEPRTSEQIEKYIKLSLQQALTRAEVIINRVEVKQTVVRPAGAPRAKGTAGRKPINRPKVEAWIREHIQAGPSTQGTTGLHGVDRNGRPLKDAPNRIYPHRMMGPEGIGLSQAALNKALGELEVMGYLERGFAAGAPFYELIRELPPEGEVGMRGRPIDEAPVYGEGATPRDLDFSHTDTPDYVVDISKLPDDELDID